MSDRTTRWLGRITALLIVLLAVRWGGLWAVSAVFVFGMAIHVWHRWKYGRWMDPW